MLSLTKALAASVLISNAAAQLLLNSAFAGTKPPLHPFFNRLVGANREDGQAPLGGGHEPRPVSSSDRPDLGPYKAGDFTVRSQDDTTCATKGESQWTGTIDVTDERRLFYWFFDSRSDPDNDPVIIWINGGPGSSSMVGMFNEMGPCIIDHGANITSPNEWAWNNNASLLFLDQPAGVGFSSLKPGAAVPRIDLDGAQDFQVFLNIFFRDVFPDKAGLPIHFAAESYGGHYAPTYVDHILQSRRYESRTAFWGNISSLVLVDAVVDFTAPHIGIYELLCSDFRGGDILNETACENIRLNLPKCESLGRSCDMSYDGYECWAMMAFCSDTVAIYYDEEVQAGRRNPFDIRKPCPDPPMCDDIGNGNYTWYLNQKGVKAALGFPEDFTFRSINMDINSAYVNYRSPFKPTTGEVASILDAHMTPGLGYIRVLVLNGNEDYVVNTPGQVWAYDNLRWSGQPEYRITRWETLNEAEIGATGFWKATRDGRLAFVGVDGAGHMVPGDVKEGSYRIVTKWLEGGWHM